MPALDFPAFGCSLWSSPGFGFDGDYCADDCECEDGGCGVYVVPCGDGGDGAGGVVADELGVGHGVWLCSVYALRAAMRRISPAVHQASRANMAVAGG